MPDTEANASGAVGDELAPGTVLCQGQYTILRYLNSGGFGVTYLAHDSLGRKVVIKECFPGAMCCRSEGNVRLRSVSHGMDFDRVVALFEREARALAQLEHPNIVGVHQIFNDNGTAYMAMDFIEGPDLFDVLEGEPERLAPEEIGRILSALLKALAYVHDHGMLHRDISPDNILLAPGGVPVLIDFGAAREGAARATRMLSRIHTVKDGYSPQEFYLAGSTQEKSSDLYALAATIHHLMIGRAPPNSNIRLAAVAQNEPDPYEPLVGRISGYDPSFLEAIDTCLSLFAKDRLRNADAWLDIISGRRGQNSGAAAMVAAPLSDDVRKRITELVTETRCFIEETRVSQDVRKAQPAEALQPHVERQEAERQYWAILNDNPAEIRAETDHACADLIDDQAEATPAVAAPNQPARSSWIGKWLGGVITPRRVTRKKPALQTVKE